MSPGPGSYTQPEKQRKNKGNSSTFKSGTKRSIDQYFTPDPSIPSAADYNLQNYKGTSYH